MLLVNPLERYWTRGRCEYDGVFVASVLVWFYFSHVLVFFGSTFFWLLRRADAYVSYMSMGSTLNTLLNYVFVIALHAPAPASSCSITYVTCVDDAAPLWHNACAFEDTLIVAPFHTTPTCGLASAEACLPCRPCGMPDYNAQALAFVVVVVGAAVLQWQPRALRRLHALALLVVYMLCVASTRFFHFKSVAQTALGVGVGTLAGVAWHVYGAFVVRPLLPSLEARFGFASAFTPRHA